jgi:hypothetical protein
MSTETKHSPEQDLPYARHVDAYVRGDGTGFFMDCPRCHFYKNAVSHEGDTCRNLTCTGTVERVAFRTISPGTTEATR